jgi:hypothetical protein
LAADNIELCAKTTARREIAVANTHSGCKQGGSIEKEQRRRKKRPAVWELVTDNIYTHRKRKVQDEDDIMICQCREPTFGGEGCGANCLNYMLNIECVPVRASLKLAFAVTQRAPWHASTAVHCIASHLQRRGLIDTALRNHSTALHGRAGCGSYRYPTLGVAGTFRCKHAASSCRDIVRRAIIATIRCSRGDKEPSWRR